MTKPLDLIAYTLFLEKLRAKESVIWLYDYILMEISTLDMYIVSTRHVPN